MPKQDILTRDFSPGNSEAMDILTLGLGRGLELGRQDVPGLKNTGGNFLASGRSRNLVWSLDDVLFIVWSLGDVPKTYSE